MLLIRKAAWCLVNYIVAVASSGHAFGKFYYESIVLLYNDHNRHTFKLPFIF